MDTSNKYSPDLWIVSRQLPSLTVILDEGVGRGWSELCYLATYPLQGHASFNTKTEYILALRLNLQAGMKILGVEMHLIFCISKRVCGCCISLRNVMY